MAEILSGEVEVIRVDELLDVNPAEIRNKKFLLDLSTDVKSGKAAFSVMEAAIVHANLNGTALVGSDVEFGHLNDDAQTIYGAKTFNVFPITPSSTPTSDYEVANKKYVDDSIVSPLWQSSVITNGVAYSPTENLKEIQIENNSQNLNLILVKNTDDVNNYAGSVFAAKGSGADFTNTFYFAKYGAGFYISSWAGNGVISTDKDLVISATGTSSNVVIETTGGTTPVERFRIDENGLLSQTVSSVAHHFSMVNSTSLAIGTLASVDLSSKIQTTLIGYQAGNAGGGGLDVFVGYQAGLNSTSGGSNVLIGNGAGKNLASGQNNTFIGFQAGLDSSLSTGVRNIIIGSDAGLDNVSDANYNLHISSVANVDVDDVIIRGLQSVLGASSQSLWFNAGDIFMNYLPSSDPSVLGQLYTNGALSGGVPRALYVSGGPSGGPCITGDALISLDENNSIRFDELKQSILTYNNETGKNEVQTFDEVITKEHIDLVSIVLSNGVELKCSLAHPWKSEKGWVSFDPDGCLKHYKIESEKISKGHKLLDKKGVYVSVISIKKITEKQLTYHLRGIKNGNYYANGILTASMD